MDWAPLTHLPPQQGTQQSWSRSWQVCRLSTGQECRAAGRRWWRIVSFRTHMLEKCPCSHWEFVYRSQWKHKHTHTHTGARAWGLRAIVFLQWPSGSVPNTHIIKQLATPVTQAPGEPTPASGLRDSLMYLNKVTHWHTYKLNKFRI